jgi:hypothetical protein
VTAKALKLTEEESFVAPTAKLDIVLELKLKIIKHIIKIRLEENAAAIAAKDRKLQKQRIMELMADKKNEALAGKSLAELQTMLEKL